MPQNTQLWCVPLVRFWPRDLSSQSGHRTFPSPLLPLWSQSLSGNCRLESLSACCKNTSESTHLIDAASVFFIPVNAARILLAAQVLKSFCHTISHILNFSPWSTRLCRDLYSKLRLLVEDWVISQSQSTPPSRGSSSHPPYFLCLLPSSHRLQFHTVTAQPWVRFCHLLLFHISTSGLPEDCYHKPSTYPHSIQSTTYTIVSQPLSPVSGNFTIWVSGCLFQLLFLYLLPWDLDSSHPKASCLFQRCFVSFKLHVFVQVVPSAWTVVLPLWKSYPPSGPCSTRLSKRSFLSSPMVCHIYLPTLHPSTLFLSSQAHCFSASHG